MMASVGWHGGWVVVVLKLMVVNKGGGAGAHGMDVCACWVWCVFGSQSLTSSDRLHRPNTCNMVIRLDRYVRDSGRRIMPKSVLGLTQNLNVRVCSSFVPSPDRSTRHASTEWW